MSAAKDDPKYPAKNQKESLMLDPRIPLGVRVMKLPLIDAWRLKWNKEHPDEPPIARPGVKYDFGDVEIPNAPKASA